MVAILSFFVGHWMLSIFAQTFFHHRYSAHRMFTLSKGWEHFFHFFAFLAQGASYLDPRAYAILHREHHAYSDTRDDPHSPLFHSSVNKMMWATKQRYYGLRVGNITPESRFTGGFPGWRGL